MDLLAVMLFIQLFSLQENESLPYDVTQALSMFLNLAFVMLSVPGLSWGLIPFLLVVWLRPLLSVFCVIHDASWVRAAFQPLSSESSVVFWLSWIQCPFLTNFSPGMCEGLITQLNKRMLNKLYIPDVICLQKTKLANISSSIVRNTLGPGFDNKFLYLPANGTRGGILLATGDSIF
jgi:hypothetical protein